MFSTPYLCICIYCMIQLIYLLIMDNRRHKCHVIQERYYPLVLTMMLLLSFVADVISSLYHSSDWIFPYAVAGNYLEILLNSMLLPIYFQYVCLHVSDINAVLKRRMEVVLWTLTAITCFFAISTFFTKEIFYFDELRNYHRGPLFWVPMSVLFLIMVIIEAFIYSQRAKIAVNYYKSLLLFLVFPIIGWGLQLLIYGLPFSLISATFAAQIVFTNIQNRSMDTDYLTGAFNRQSLDLHIQNKIEHISDRHSFSALLLDIDNFKAINDCFGHYEGDIALINAAKLFRVSVGRKDFVARYGGDEFCIILEEDDSISLEQTVNQIKDKFQEFNKNSKKPYQLSFSVGYAVYDPKVGKKAEQFLKIIDQHMYNDKRFRKMTHPL